MFVNISTHVILLSIIISMVTRVQGHPPVIHRSTVQEIINTDEMQVSFVQGSTVVTRAVTQYELEDFSADWDETATADPWKLVSDR